MRQMLGEDADEERGGDGAGRGDPAPRVPHRGPRGLLRASAGREGDDARRPAQMIELLQDARVLTRQPFGRERGVGFADHARGDVAERRGQHETAVLAALALAQVRFVNGSERIGKANLDQPIVGEVSAVHTAGVSGSRPRASRLRRLTRPLEQLAELADRAEQMHAHSRFAQPERLTDFAGGVLGDVAEREHEPLPIGQLLDGGR